MIILSFLHEVAYSPYAEACSRRRMSATPSASPNAPSPIAGAVMAPVWAREVFGEGVVEVLGEGVASVVDSEGEGVGELVCGVVADGVGVEVLTEGVGLELLGEGAGVEVVTLGVGAGVLVVGVGVGVGVGVAFSSPSTSPHPTVSIAIVFSVTCPFTTAVFLKVLPIVALAGTFSSV